MSEGTVTVRAEFRVLGSRDEVDALFADLQAHGMLTAPESVVLQFKAYTEEAGFLMRDKLQEILHHNRAVVKDEKKTGVTITSKQPTPKPTARQQMVALGQQDMFEPPNPPPPPPPPTANLSPKERVLAHLRDSVHSQTPEQVANATSLSVQEVITYLDTLFDEDKVEPNGNAWEYVAPDLDEDD